MTIVIKHHDIDEDNIKSPRASKSSGARLSKQVASTAPCATKRTFTGVWELRSRASGQATRATSRCRGPSRTLRKRKRHCQKSCKSSMKRSTGALLRSLNYHLLDPK